MLVDDELGHATVLISVPPHGSVPDVVWQRAIRDVVQLAERAMGVWCSICETREAVTPRSSATSRTSAIASRMAAAA